MSLWKSALLRAAEERLAALDRVLAIAEFDLNGVCLVANDSFASLLGYSRQDIIGQSHVTFLPATAAESPDYLQFWARLRAGAFHAGRFCRQRRDGQEIWIEAFYTPVLNRT